MPNRILSGDNLVLAILAMSLALNVYVGVRTIANRPAPAQVLEVGKSVPDMVIETADGRPYTVAATGDKPLLLYAFTSTCGWCRLNKPNIEAIARQVSGRFRFVPVCLDCTAKRPFSLGDSAAFINPSDTTVLAYKLGFVPMTTVISTTGTVETIWRGAFVSTDLRSSVESTLGVRLPPMADKSGAD